LRLKNRKLYSRPGTKVLKRNTRGVPVLLQDGIVLRADAADHVRFAGLKPHHLHVLGPGNGKSTSARYGSRFPAWSAFQ